MFKHFHVFYMFSMLLLFTSGRIIKIAKVNGAQCEEEMGICDGSCNSRCEISKREFNGKGRCEKSSPNDVGTCKCLYNCGGNSNGKGNGNGNSSPKQKRCNVGIGPCTFACSDVCCEQNCAAKFPGPYDGHGLCLAVIHPYNECICYFNC